MSTPTLYHFTCDHGYKAIGAEGKLLSPLGQRPDLMERHRSEALHLFLSIIWLTDLPMPDRFGLGLTMDTIRCDRTGFRYRATDTGPCMPYGRIRMRLEPRLRDALELAELAKPQHWWVAFDPVAVVYDPIGGQLP